MVLVVLILLLIGVWLNDNCILNPNNNKLSIFVVYLVLNINRSELGVIFIYYSTPEREKVIVFESVGVFVG